jgi:hypothetical protein
MTTEAIDLETILDAEQPEQSQPAPATEAPAGVTDSAAPPADAGTSQTVSPEAEPPSVPRAALEDERKKRQELERKLAEFERQMKPQQQPPQQQPQITQADLERLWWENPSEAAAIVQHIAVVNATQRAQEAMLSRELDRSQRRAEKTHGAEAVAKALQEAQRVGKASDFINEDDPYESLMGWFQDVEAVRNPQSVQARVDEMVAAKLAELGVSPAAPRASSVAKAAVPKSLASTASAQPRDDRGRFSGPTPLEDIIG